jgi:hypothetical protein
MTASIPETVAVKSTRIAPTMKQDINGSGVLLRIHLGAEPQGAGSHGSNFLHRL